MKHGAIVVLVLALAVAGCGTPVDNATSTLIEQVRLGDPLAQGTYAENQELLESEEAFPIWLDTLQTDESPQVQTWAAQMLGNIGNPEALPALAAAMSESRDVRDAAVAAIRQFEEEDATRAFLMVLEDGSRDAKAIALSQLSRVADSAAVDSVKSVAASDDPLLSETAANTLGDIGTPEAATALADLAVDTSLSEGVRAAAIANLGRIDAAGDEVERVAAALTDEEGADALRARVEQLR